MYKKKQIIDRVSPSEAEIRTMIVGYLAGELEIEPNALDVDTTFVRNGVSSLTAVGMTGVLEDRLRIPLDKNLPFEYPTIKKLSIFLANRCDDLR